MREATQLIPNNTSKTNTCNKRSNAQSSVDILRNNHEDEPIIGTLTLPTTQPTKNLNSFNNSALGFASRETLYAPVVQEKGDHYGTNEDILPYQNMVTQPKMNNLLEKTAPASLVVKPITFSMAG